MQQNLTHDKSPLIQVITWANVDPDFCHNMASLGHNELTLTVFLKIPQLPTKSYDICV